MISTDRLSLVFSALADPTRRSILARLAAGPAAVTELAAPFEMSLPAVSKHLKVLEKAGLVVKSREAQWRPCRLEPAPLREIADWLDEYRSFWEGSLDRLDAYLAEIQQPTHAGETRVPDELAQEQRPREARPKDNQPRAKRTPDMGTREEHAPEKQTQDQTEE